jgi:hypothetical protein
MSTATETKTDQQPEPSQTRTKTSETITDRPHPTASPDGQVTDGAISALRGAQNSFLASWRGWTDTALANNRALLNETVNLAEQCLGVQRAIWDAYVDGQRAFNSRVTRDHFPWAGEI